MSSDASFSDKDHQSPNPLGPIDDETLASQAAAGSEEAFERLILRYQDRIFNLFFQLCHSKTEAEDLSQETFMKAYRALGKFRQQAKFYTWLFRIAVNTGISRGRQITRLREREGVRYDTSTTQSDDNNLNNGTNQFAANENSDPAAQFERGSLREQVRVGLEKLSLEYKTILILRDMEGLDYETIAGTLSISRAAVKSRLHRARSQLARILKDLRPEKNNSD